MTRLALQIVDGIVRLIYMVDDDDGDDDPKEADAPLVAPPPETRRAIAQQYTPRVMQAARRYAERRATLVRRAGRPVPKNYARELVDDAHADTWFGKVTWNPRRCNLLVHLRGVIYDRTWSEIKRAARHPHLSLDAPANDRSWTIDRGEVEHALAHASSGECSPLLLHALLVRVCGELRRMADGDRDGLALIWCWEQSITDREEVLDLTGLDESAYERARKRLLYLSRDLPPELREAAQDQLRNAS